MPFQKFDNLHVPSNVFSCKKCKSVIIGGKFASFCPKCGRELPWDKVRDKTEFGIEI